MSSCSLVFLQASLGALHCLSILAERALHFRDLTDRLRALEKENESLKKGCQELKKKNEEVVAESSELRKKVSDLGKDLTSERATHHDQVSVINAKV